MIVRRTQRDNSVTYAERFCAVRAMRGTIVIQQTEHETGHHVAKHAAKKDDAKPKHGRTSKKAVRPAKSHRFAKSMAAACVGIAAYGLVYAAGVSYFSTHFVPGTMVNGSNVSWCTEAELASQLEANAMKYEKTVKAGDLQITLNADDIGLTTNSDTSAHEARERIDAWSWPLQLFNPQRITVEEGTSFDEERLSQSVASAVDAYNENATDPRDAGVEFDEETRSYKVRKQKLGTKLNKDAVVKAVRTNVAAQEGETDLGNEVLEQPERKEDAPELVEAVEKANNLLDLDIPLVKDGREEARVSRDQLADWVHVEDDLSVSVDSEAVAAWTRDTLSERMTTSDDEYDYSLDAEATTSSLLRGMENTSEDAVGIEVVATKKEVPQETQQANASGSWDKGQGRYIDVDLGSQYAWFYDANGSVIWESYIVSGNTGVGRSTPTGTYNIYAKETNQELVGMDYDHDGYPDYRSRVNYWMPFSGGYGLHDATWRDSFGGDIYSYDGSHGCVNLPYDAAASLFSLASVGEKVIVHW